MQYTLTNTELSKITDILRIAVINRAMHALNVLLNEPIECENIKSMNVKLNDIDNNSKYMNNACSVFINGKGDLNLSLLMILDSEDAKWIASKMIGVNVDEIDELSISTISELGNILLIGSFINTIANITNFKIDCSVPGFTIENHRAVLQYAILEHVIGDEIIIASITLLCKKSNKRLHISLIFNPEDAKKLVR